jgi:hypothetical protein
MTIIVDWYNDNHTEIVNTHIGDWTWEELFAALDQTVQLMNTVNHKVNVISDFRQSRHIPFMRPSILQKVADAAIRKQRNRGLYFVIGANGFIKSLYGIFNKLYPRSVAEYQFIEDDEQLQTLLLDKQSKSAMSG